MRPTPLILAAPLLALSCTETKVSDYNTPPSATIRLPADGATFPEGDAVEFEGLVQDGQQAPETLTISWTSDLNGQLNTDPADSDGVAQFATGSLRAGNHVITLQVTDSKGVTEEDWISLAISDVEDAPTIRVLSPEEDETGVEGVPFELQVVVEDEQDQPLDLLVRMSSGTDGSICALTPEASGVASCDAALSVGEHTLLFEVEDTDGNVTSEDMLFEVIALDAIDDDGDGFTEAEGDCDDNDDDIYPEAGEVYNDTDDDCDTIVDEGTVNYDDDGDGQSELDGDCDDTDASIYEGAPEDCNSIDDDCDDAVDEETDCTDDDLDGYHEGDGDCDDDDDDVYPGAVETADGVDEDCDGTIDEGTEVYDDDGDCFCEEADCVGSVSEDCEEVVEGDCDDEEVEVNPDAEEACDEIDNNCDGEIDEDAAGDAGSWYADGDYDGYGDADDVVYSCSQPPGYVADSTDCNDDLNTVNPGAPESCDEIDNDCDSSTDEGVQNTYYVDADDDGYGDASSTTEACSVPDGYSALSTDCDDTDAAYNPGADEDDCADPNDYNCDGRVGYEDGDGDGYAACEECDDSDASINPGAAEVCDEQDNDCDDDTDEGLTSIFYRDSDSDGYGNPAIYEEACTAPSNYVSDNTDCNDSSAAANPGETEVCDNIDNNCNGSVDEASAADAVTWYDDDDSDGYGDADDTTTSCSQPAGYVASDTDCDDTRAGINPGATETCDEEDDDCDGDIDEGVTTTWYADYDSDEYGDPDVTTEACSEPSSYVDNDGDCDDDSSSVYPGATEYCNGEDDNCDGFVDEDTAADADTWYADADEDGYGDSADAVSSCEAIDGYVSNSRDCDDADDAINPAATETCNEVDDDCDSATDEGVETRFYADSDSDGYGNPALYTEACEAPENYVSNNSDCNDTTSAANPGEDEVCDSIDNNCDGDVDEDEAVDADTWYYDSDSDGYGDASLSTRACDQPATYVANDDDCDDDVGSVNPGESEDCNEIDDDCDGGIDEGVTDTFYADFDGDDFGDADDPIEACELPDGYADNDEDCDDSASASNPDASEICDGLDNDCDTNVDEGATDDATWYYDGDSDGYGDPAVTQEACERPTDYVANANDCDDDDASVSPAADESCNEVDDDCDGDTDEGVQDTYYADDDNDGYGDEGEDIKACSAPDGYVSNDTDCNDASAAIFPGATETCNDLDDDCDVSIDEDGSDATTWYRDSDSDGYGNAAVSQDACDQPANYVANASDCDDDSSGVNPGAVETCDGEDDDCDSSTDEGVQNTYYADFDGDSYGDPDASTQACSQPGNYVTDNSDCDPDVGSVHPGATEYCDEVDNDCDATVDEEGAADVSTWFADDDSDGYGDADDALTSCDAVSGYVANSSDCDDTDGDIYPSAAEECDGLDQDCDGGVDEGVKTTWYADDDSDGYGDDGVSTQACSAPTGYVSNDDDCNDNTDDAYPGATEYCDEIDNNCDGAVDESSSVDATTWYYDSDSDNYGNAAISTVACDQPANYVANDDDCNDGSAVVNPGSGEACDSIDNDCDTAIDEDVTSDWYLDDDGDGYGDPDAAIDDCSPPDGYVSNDEDCDDDDPSINPDTVWYQDRDSDGYGGDNDIAACEAPSGYVSNSDDCADANPSRYPGADEYCDDLDNDCDGETDETDAVDCVDWYLDEDGDGYGSSTSSCECGPVGDYDADNSDDCYDNNANAHPSQGSWFSSDRGDGSFDYNCDGTNQRRYTALYECSVDVLGLSCDDNDGWDASSTPSCGSSDTWQYDGCTTLCVLPNSYSRTQTCH